MRIEELEDFSAIQQIGRALWRIGAAQGAAVMVGAGFSRNADLPATNSAKPPLWEDFADAMKATLYPSGEASLSFLRLAEEYRTLLGQAALEGLIRELVRDAEWLPGAQHKKLLDLPWADVLTTNWDTLLERAAPETANRQKYDVVKSIQDIPLTHAPRIVKLHGSLPSNRPFIFAEEDYRSYPRKFAPFVNLVQQVLLENDLCLLGFSGDDPNFLAWSGWVRDQLEAAARRIYLVGVLNISPSRRKFLEARGISPIDLAPLAGSNDAGKHQVASDKFLDFLKSLKPRPTWDWSVTGGCTLSHQHVAISINDRDLVAGAQRVKEIGKQWKREREAYPSWLVCPAKERQMISSEMTQIMKFLVQVLPGLGESDFASVLYEAAWRCDVGGVPALASLRELIGSAITDFSSSLSADERTDLANLLLRNAREDQDSEAFGRWSQFLEDRAGANKDRSAAVAYEKALWCRDRLDYNSLRLLLPQVDGRDPAWKLRRAALLCELGEFDTFASLVRQAFQDLRDRHYLDRSSIWVISRLAWADHLLRPFETESIAEHDGWNEMFHVNRCDARQELYGLDSELNEASLERTEDTRLERASFDPGRLSRTVLLRGHLTIPYDVMRLAEAAGIPSQIRLFDMMRSRLSHAIELGGVRSERDWMAFIRCLSGPTDKRLERMLGRIQVARMPLELVEQLVIRLRAAIDFGRGYVIGQHTGVQGPEYFWTGRLALYTEVLSRLTVRLTSRAALEAFSYAVALANSPEKYGSPVWEPIRNLLQRAFSAMSPTEASSLLVEILNLPLPEERGIHRDSEIRGLEQQWPDLSGGISSSLAVDSQSEPAVRSRIASLISLASGSTVSTRNLAIQRLCYLHASGLLTSEEINGFGHALWKRGSSEGKLPTDLILRPYMLLFAPSPDPQLAKTLFRSNVIEPGLNSPISYEFLANVVGATSVGPGGSRVFELTVDEAKALLAQILRWRPLGAHLDLFLEEPRIKRTIGTALSTAVLPQLSFLTLGSENIDALFEVIDSGVSPCCVEGLPQLVRMDPSRRERAVQFVRRAAHSRDTDTIAAGFNAIWRWLELAQGEKEMSLPHALREDVLSAVSNGNGPGLRHALHLATDFCRKGELTSENLQRLADALEALDTETSYENWQGSDSETASVTIVRQQCVLLAHELQKVGVVHSAIESWSTKSKVDPIPEVRYAIEIEERRR